MSHSNHNNSGQSHSHDSQDHASHLKVYWAVGIALLIGTVVTVLAREWEFNSVALTISVALFIASIKAFLVCGWFMHLLSEKKVIYLTLVTTVAFAIGMVALIMWSDKDPITGSKAKTVYVP